MVEHPLVVESGKFMGREVVGLDPGPYVFSVNSLLDLVQRLSREHPIDIDVVAEVGEEGVLSLGAQCQKLRSHITTHCHVLNRLSQ